MSYNTVQKTEMPYEILEGKVGVGDMCLLEPLTEDNFVENLKTRFFADHIYTYIGNVVVSVNPYKHLDIYEKEVIQDYKGKNIYEMPPHIYAIGDEAYGNMRDYNKDQCVIICGESGAGKTEASKTIMQYVAEVSGKGKEIDHVKEKLLQSNPILEAFGNAKTNKNDNSSRFGKYMDVEFDFKGDPLGGVITSYLLEKSRLVFQNKGERNFHIFYQLLSSNDTNFLDGLGLKKDASYYSYLDKSGCVKVSCIDDAANFTTTKKAMETLGFPENDVNFIFKMLSAILNIGNFQFVEQSSNSGMDGCALDVDKNNLSLVASLIGCRAGGIIEALTKRTVTVNNESVQTNLSCSEALYAKDALCKALYARMFSWIIHLINTTIKVSSKDKMKSLGVLDIYGFEVFEHNSFEQFIINYCNEKLQQIFIDLTLKEEQAEYINEGIEWIHVDYFNNAVICDLIENNKTGILSLLDEECLLPGDTSDTTFLTKIIDVNGNHEHFESRGSVKPDKSLNTNQFRLVHYAGNVTYTVAGFLDKNNDLLFKDLSRLMFFGNHPQLQQLFPDGDPLRINMKRPATAGYQFKVSVAELMKNLLSKSPNYIRCIKPNDYKRSGDFVESLVRHQVRYLGLMENVRVRRAGYAYRQTYKEFLNRYKMLTEETWPNWHEGSCKEGVEYLMKTLGFSEEEYAMGNSKIFIRNPKTLFSLEAKRKNELNTLATIIATKYRSWIARKKFLRMKEAEILIAAIYKGYKEKTRYKRLRDASIIICSFVRGWKTRKQFRHHFKSVAGPKIVSFIKRALIYKYLISMTKNLPSSSPTDARWPDCGLLYMHLSQKLKLLYHRNRCLKYRLNCDEARRNKMRMKLAASELFYNKKSLYPSSVPVEFKGDHLKLSQNPKWTAKNKDYNVIFSDNVAKINRKDGKAVPHVLVLNGKELHLLNAKNFSIKTTVLLENITNVLMSGSQDCFAVINMPQNKENNKKGDLLIACCNIIEFITMIKIHNKNLSISFSDKTSCNMYGACVEVSFKNQSQNGIGIKDFDTMLKNTLISKSKESIDITNMA